MLFYHNIDRFLRHREGLKILTYVTLLILCSSLHIQEAKAQSKFTTLQILPSHDNPRNSEGDFITRKDGSILFIYTRFTGQSASDFAGSDLVSRISHDRGKTWSSEDRMVVKNEGEMNTMSVSLLRLASGKIALFYLRKNSLGDCRPHLRISSDEGESWSEPVVCINDQVGYYVLNNNRVIQLASGRLLMPVALHTSNFKPNATLHELEKSFNSYGKIYCYFSDDEGKTWTRSERVSIPDSIIAQEPGVVELVDGSVLMYIRTNAGTQYFSKSTHRGERWTPANPSSLVSPLSPASIVRLPNSLHLLAVWNHNTQTDPALRGRRTPLTLAVSPDNGTTWKGMMDIETDPKGSYCYTGIHFTSDHILLNYFDWHTRGVYVVRIPFQEIHNHD